MRVLLKIFIWFTAAVAALMVVGWLLFVPMAREAPYVFVSSWGEKGSGPGQFLDPTGIAVSGGAVFVSDARNGRIQVFGRDGTFRRVIGEGRLGRPMNLSVTGGALYVADYWKDTVQVYGLDGTHLRTIGGPGSQGGDFDAPGGVAVGPDGALYVADFYNQRIQVLGRDGTFRRQWGKTREVGSGPGQFNYPTDVAASADGSVYVADGYNDRIQKFGADGKLAVKWGGPLAMNIFGPFQGWFATVTGIALDQVGNVFVADFYNHRVQKFTPDGTFLTSFGGKKDKPGHMTYPMAVAVGEDGMIYVADYGANKIQTWKPAPGTTR